MVGAEEWHGLGGGVVFNGQLWEVIELKHISINVFDNRIALTFKVKAPCSPQTVGVADEEVMDEAVVALSAVTELEERLELEGETEALLIKVVNVRIDEVGVNDGGDDEGVAIISVNVSSARDVGPTELGRTEEVKADVAVDIN